MFVDSTSVTSSLQNTTMKNFLLSFLLYFMLPAAFSQQAKQVLQPDSICGKDALVWNAPGFSNGTTNYGAYEAMGAHAWTNQGTPDTARSLLQFDLSTIPVGSVITYAYLSLFNNPTTAYAQGQHSTLSGPNDLFIQRIISPWMENSVTWFSQPVATSQNEVSVASSTSAHQDYPSINVTALVQDMVDNPLTSFGFMIRLQDEGYYRAMVFATSDYTDPAKRPMLVINYVLPASGCFELKPLTGCGKDAMVWNAPGHMNGTTNYGSSDAFGPHAWTNQGTPDTSRSLLQFDLSAIPGNAVITSAVLSLYNNPTTVFGQGEHSWLSGPNSALIQRITSPWDERMVTWMTQPSSTSMNEVWIPASTNIHQDYPGIDVTQLVTDMYSNPNSSFGFMVRLEFEEYYRALVFASNNEADETKHPWLEVCYSVSDKVQAVNRPAFYVYPNPAHHSLYIESSGKPNEVFTVTLYNLLGEIVLPEVQCGGRAPCEIPLENISDGVYVAKVYCEAGTFEVKVMKD
jgi:hypothetical protein